MLLLLDEIPVLEPPPSPPSPPGGPVELTGCLPVQIKLTMPPKDEPKGQVRVSVNVSECDD